MQPIHSPQKKRKEFHPSQQLMIRKMENFCPKTIWLLNGIFRSILTFFLCSGLAVIAVGVPAAVLLLLLLSLLFIPSAAGVTLETIIHWIAFKGFHLNLVYIWHNGPDIFFGQGWKIATKLYYIHYSWNEVTVWTWYSIFKVHCASQMRLPWSLPILAGCRTPELPAPVNAATTKAEADHGYAFWLPPFFHLSPSFSLFLFHCSNNLILLSREQTLYRWFLPHSEKYIYGGLSLWWGRLNVKLFYSVNGFHGLYLRYSFVFAAPMAKRWKLGARFGMWIVCVCVWVRQNIFFLLLSAALSTSV